MADTKITALAAIATVDPAADVLPIVDISDTSMAASGTTKKVTTNQILQAGGTATLASATITGAATVGTTLGVTGVSTLSSNVGIGITPSAWASNYRGLQMRESWATIFSDNGNGVCEITTNAYNDGAWKYANALKAARYQLDAASGQHEWYTAGTGTVGGTITDFATAQMTLNGSGNLSLATGNIVMSTSGKGIDFSAVTGGTGTATANVLNDYEEGTWIPTDASGAGLVFTLQNCRYTKIGRAVTVQGSITYPATVNASNALWGGFPFNAADIITLSVIYTDASLATFTYLSGNTGNVYLLTPGVNTINSTVSGKTITFSGTYMV